MLPEPAQVEALCALAAHEDPDAQAQATELCRVLPLPVRLLAAERLVDRGGHVVAAVGCVWPAAPEVRAAVLWALAVEVVAMVLPTWEAARPRETAPRRLYVAATAADRPVMVGALVREVQAVTRLSSLSPAVRASGAVVLALCAPSAAQAAQEALALAAIASGNAAATARWAASRLRRQLEARAALPWAERRVLVEHFIAALDALALERAALLLTAGCVWEVRGQEHRGPEAIFAAYRQRAVQARATFARVESRSRLRPDPLAQAEGEAAVDCEDQVHHAGRAHLFRSRLHLHLDAAGRIWRLRHADLPGEVAAFQRFAAEVRGLSR